MSHLSKVLVVDVEATCWENDAERNGQPNEIIEIGICQLDVPTRQLDKIDSIVVKPTLSTVSKFCENLTGWTQADVDGGMSIKEAIQLINDEYRPAPKQAWFSCGIYDKKMLTSTSRFHGIGNYVPLEMNPFDKMQHFNVKTLFALKHRLKREMGLEGMLKYLNLEMEGRHHNGADDAKNISKIVLNILGR